MELNFTGLKLRNILEDSSEEDLRFEEFILPLYLLLLVIALYTLVFLYYQAH